MIKDLKKYTITKILNGTKKTIITISIYQPELQQCLFLNTFSLKNFKRYKYFLIV